MKDIQEHAMLVPEIIRRNYFLDHDAVISEELIASFIQGKERGSFEQFARLSKSIHPSKPSIFFTHDIDWLSPFHPYSVINFFRSKISGHRWLNLKELTHHNTFLKNIDRLASFEQNNGIQSTYFIGALDQIRFGRYEIRYSTQNSLYAELISILKQYHHRIGLQSSYRANQLNSIPDEKKRMESLTGQKIIAHRSHYLHYESDTLYKQLQSCGILFELGFGKPRTPGFLNRFPGKFNYSGSDYHKPLTILPLILMDNAFFHKPYAEVMLLLQQALDELCEYGGSACISFHPENLLLKQELRAYYEEIIHICVERGIDINPSYN